jgi:hypothetical protein
MKFSLGDIALMVGFGVVGVFSLMASLIPPGTVACAVPVLGALLAIAMVIWKGRTPGTSSWLTAGSTVLLTIGVWWIAAGVFVLTESVEPGQLAEDLAMAAALCFAPGGFLTLLSGGLFWYQLRRAEEEETAVAPAQLSETQIEAEIDAFLAGEGSAGADASSQLSDKPGQILKRAAEKAAAEKPVNPQVQIYRQQLEQARRYREKIVEFVRDEKRAASYGERLSQITAELDRWEDRLKRLVGRLIAFEENEVLQEDLTAVPAAIERLQEQQSAESDPQLTKEITQTLDAYQRQQEQLDALARLMRRTQLDLEETIAAIGTLYSQMEVLSAMDIDSSRAQRLSHEVSEEVERLSDLLSAVEEVYSHSPYRLKG